VRLLWFNLATDADDPILGFSSSWLRAVAERVESVHVLTMRTGRVEVPENVYVHSVGKEKGYSEPRRAWEFYRLLFHVLRHDRVDACFSHMMPLFSSLAAPVLKPRRIPIVTWYAHLHLSQMLKLAHRLSSRMVTSLRSTYPYRHDKLVVLGQGIDTDLFTPGDSMLVDEAPMILCVGRLSLVKDHPTLLKAACRLRQRHQEPFQVVVVAGPAGPGDASYIRSLHEQVRELGLRDTVRFEPPVAMAQLPHWYRRCAVHVNLTGTGSGDKVALEAMSSARPCLVANEGFEETLGDYADLLLFRQGDAEDLASKLMGLLQRSVAERQAIGRHLRERVVGMHSLERLADRLVALLGDTMPPRTLSLSPR
jgi:glycosyltransferase involved in cell wall biosynthesis